MMNAQWTDERKRLAVDSIKDLLIVKYNFREFYDYRTEKKKIVSQSSK